jgi:hypothetical protein
MVEIFKTLIGNQYEAALKTLATCIERCPDDAWHAPVCNHKFCQSVFHGLFFTDLYLGPNPEAIESQPFHLQHAEVFAGYEEWEDRAPEKTYQREFIDSYLQHCREKARKVVSEFTESSIAAPSGFSWIPSNTGEVHVYNIRHLQHHAAQLSLRLRIDHGVDVPWEKSGWSE